MIQFGNQVQFRNQVANDKFKVTSRLKSIVHLLNEVPK
jgi:hypothetical protein